MYCKTEFCFNEAEAGSDYCSSCNVGSSAIQGPKPITLMESLAFVGVGGIGLAFTGMGALQWWI